MAIGNAGKRFWAIYLKRLAFELALIFTLGIAWELAFLESYQRNGLTAGLIAVLVYLAASFTFSMVTGISGLAYLWIFGGNDLKEGVLADLRNARLPGPKRHQAKRFDYLIELADDASEEVETRIRAAALHIGYQVAVQRSGLLAGLALTKALDEATLRYSEEAPEL